MDDKWTFSFRKSQPIQGKLIPAEEYEKLLLSKLNEQNEDHQSTRFELMVFYRSTCRVADAMYYAEEFISHTSDTEEKAVAYFLLGQAMEHINDFESAVRFYSEALVLEPSNRFYWYFIHNNIGFSLNQLMRYEDAEKFLREAITIDPSRANAFKNLGLSFEGQCKFADAAQSYIGAARADAADQRALRHLEDLVGRREELLTEVPDLLYHIHKCREAVEFVARRNKQE